MDIQKDDRKACGKEQTGDKDWKVTFEGGFYGQRGRQGIEIPVGKTFSWGKEIWHVPAAVSYTHLISGQASGLAYPTSKFAVNGLTISLARELGPKGIRVNAVAPGITETDMMKAVPKEVMDPLVRQIPLRRLGRCV